MDILLIVFYIVVVGFLQFSLKNKMKFILCDLFITLICLIICYNMYMDINIKLFIGIYILNSIWISFLFDKLIEKEQKIKSENIDIYILKEYSLIDTANDDKRKSFGLICTKCDKVLSNDKIEHTYALCDECKEKLIKENKLFKSKEIENKILQNTAKISDYQGKMMKYKEIINLLEENSDTITKIEKEKLNKYKTFLEEIKQNIKILKAENYFLKALQSNNIVKLQEEYHEQQILLHEEEKRKLEEEREKREKDIAVIDGMDGIEFEDFCQKLFQKNGYSNVILTPISGDQGVDIIAEKNDLRYAIQCKRYSSRLGNTPIQEVFTGKEYYDCNIGVVITNSIFTKSAKELAEKINVKLIDREKLQQMMENM